MIYCAIAVLIELLLLQCTPERATEQVRLEKSCSVYNLEEQLPTPEPAGKHLCNNMNLLDPLIFQMTSKLNEDFFNQQLDIWF